MTSRDAPLVITFFLFVVAERRRACFRHARRAPSTLPSFHRPGNGNQRAMRAIPLKPSSLAV